MPDRFDHLRLTRQQPVNPRRTRGGGGGVKPPDDVVAHAQTLLEAVSQAEAKATALEKGFDPRLLLKLNIEGLDPSELAAIRGVEVVSHEEKTVVAVFTSADARSEFEHRLNVLARGGTPTRKDILFAISGVDTWGREDRLGRSLRTEGIPQTDAFVVDVELWLLERQDERVKMLTAFQGWCQAHSVTLLDQANQLNVVLARVRLGKEALERLLLHRDVRRIELPPRFKLPFELHRIPLNDYPIIPSPPADAPGIAILDSGLITGHPLLAPAVGDSTSYLNGRGPEDENGHGTMVAGLALYGDVASCAERRAFIPEIRLFSGRLTNEENSAPDTLLENQIPQAVAYFLDTYGCRIFNISLGDDRRPYIGGHLGPLAAMLDTLAREHGVLFVISAGNFLGSENGPQNWVDDYPRYLLAQEDAHIIDPAPALNALTVGSLARHEQSRMEARNPNALDHRAIARRGEPSPFSRTGPSVREAIKPDVVEFGGNWYVHVRAGGHRTGGEHDLGETSTSHSYATNNLLISNSGTSFACPKVAHLAARLLKRYPNASHNLLRSLIVGHARIPDAAQQLFTDSPEDLRRIVGYGQPALESCLDSTEQRVTLVAEEKLGENAHHFFEVPIPDDFLATPTRRPRQLRIALAHTPYVRASRLEYKGSEFDFRLIRAATLEDVTRIYRRTPGGEQRIAVEGEIKGLTPGISVRSKGTAQAAVWEIQQTSRRWAEERLFIVVTRQTRKWAEGRVPEEPYSLVVVLEDNARQESRLYSQIRTQLQTRVRPRVRV